MPACTAYQVSYFKQNQFQERILYAIVIQLWATLRTPSEDPDGSVKVKCVAFVMRLWHWCCVGLIEWRIVVKDIVLDDCLTLGTFF